MHEWPTSGWLYDQSDDRPGNLGIWIDYRIAKAYYEQATDKRVAIRRMLNIPDYRQFLEESGYRATFEKPVTATAPSGQGGDASRFLIEQR